MENGALGFLPLLLNPSRFGAALFVPIEIDIALILMLYFDF